MEENSLIQIQEKFQALMTKANVCRALGAIDTMAVDFDITSDREFEVSVAIDRYRESAAQWKASQHCWGDDQECHANMQQAEDLEKMLDEKIARAKARLERQVALINTLNA